MKQIFLLCCIALFGAGAGQAPKKLKLPKAYVYIPSGQITQDGEKISIQGFFMQKGEVTNLNYREFLHDLKTSGDVETYEKVRVRLEGWNQAGQEMGGVFAKNYHQHPAYEEYPVVNITHEAALLYCDWLSKRLEIKYPEATFTVRLPSEIEWKYAALGGHSDIAYPHGNYLRNSKGAFLYNFRHLGDEAIHKNPETGEIEVIQDVQKKHRSKLQTVAFGPLAAESLQPNDFGLYNMSGNVAEMLATAGRTKGGCYNSTGYDIRIDGPDEFAGFTDYSPYIGFRPIVTYVEKKKK